MTLPVVALLGRKDEPTDAVEDYCRYLGAALQAHDIQLQIRRVSWEIHGWHESLHELRVQASDWRGKWVLLQYTALAWSARGFPLRFLRVLKMLKSAGARVGIVFHDVEPYSSPRLIDQVRRRVQVHVMRGGLDLCDLSILTVPAENLCWPKEIPRTSVFIPVGPNLPFPDPPIPKAQLDLPTIGVFSITGGEQGARETQVILQVACRVSQRLGKLRLSVFGRHSELREAALRDGLREFPVQLSVEGTLEPEEVVERFAECDVLLFVRQGISSRRSSAIAGIAAGLPIVAYSGTETAPPVTSAGVVLVDPNKSEQLSNELVEILTNPNHCEELSARSRSAYHTYFSWSAIAKQLITLLRSA